MMDFTQYWGAPLAPQYLQWLFNGLQTTLVLSFEACALGTLLGVALCLAQRSSWRLLAWPAGVFQSVFRNTPLLVQLFFWYFGVPGLLPATWVTWLNMPHEVTLGGIELEGPSFEFIAALWGLSLYTAAFIAEECRAGIDSVRTAQRQAGTALGLSASQVWRYVVLPQALRNVMPPLMGQYMNAVKNSSLAMAIGLAELSYASRQVETETLKTFQAFAIATVLYIVVVAMIEVAAQLIQRSRRYRCGRQGH